MRARVCAHDLIDRDSRAGHREDACATTNARHACTFWKIARGRLLAPLLAHSTETRMSEADRSSALAQELRARSKRWRGFSEVTIHEAEPEKMPLICFLLQQVDRQ
jgi:hypothetical protein